MKKIFYLTLLFFCVFTIKASAQYAYVGAAMDYPVDAGILNGVNAFSVTMDTSPNPDHFFYYKFTLDHPMSLIVSLCSSEIDTYLQLLDVNGNELASNDDNGPECTGTASSIVKILPAGTYYALAQGAGPYDVGNITIFIMGTGDYSGTSFSSPIDAGPLNQSYHFTDTKNNDPSNPIGFTDNLGQPNPEIYYKFSVDRNSTVTASLCNSSIQGYVHLFDSNYNEIATGDINGGVCYGVNASLTKVIPVGTYYVVSEGAGTLTGDIATSISVVPWSGLSVSDPVFAGGFGNCIGGSFSDVANNDGTNLFTNQIGQASNDIYYSFYVTSTTNINVSHQGSDINTYMHILNGSGAEIGSDSYTGPLGLGLYASIQMTLTPGVYYVVSEGAGSQTGNIVTSISTTAIPNVPSPLGANLQLAKDFGTLVPNAIPVGNLYTPSDCYESTTNSQYSSSILNQIYYKFTLAATAQVTISNCGSTGGYFLNLFDGSGHNQIATASFGGPACSSNDLSASMVITLPQGVYYITVPEFTYPMYSVYTSVVISGGSGVPTLPSGPGPFVTNTTPLASSPSSNQNYISTIIPTQPFKDASVLPGRTISEVRQVIQYFDGIGRPSQVVQVKASAQGNDIVQPIAYDQYGKESIRYFPYALASSATSDGSYKTTALSDQAAFYNPVGSSGEQLGNGIAHITTPYAVSDIERSPLNRLNEQGAAGDEWQLSTSTVAGAGHTSKIFYATNDANSLTSSTGYWAKQFSVNINPTTGARTVSDLGDIQANTLSVTVTTSENWTAGKLGTTEEYKDFKGRLVLKRTFNNNNGNAETLSTYYIYDDFGNLCFVLPPKAEGDNASSAPLTQPILDNLCYQYTYDGRQRVVGKKFPGAGWIFYVYNKLDQVVMSQDANQRNKSPQEWSFIKYDAYGRAVMTGIYPYPGSSADNSLSAPDKTELVSLQSSTNSQTSLWETKDNTTQTGYTNVTIPQGTVTYLSINYYDNYIIPNLPGQYLNAYLDVSNPTGLLTASKTAVLNSSNNDMLWTVNYYDAKGRVHNSYVQHYFGGVYDVGNYSESTYTYDFNNNIINRQSQIYKISAGVNMTSLGIVNSYVFDHWGRKKQVWEALGNFNILLSQIDYNEVGQPYNKYLYSENSGATYLEKLTYNYNERGWLRAINDADNYLNIDLRYNHPASAIQQWNGNISEMHYNVNKVVPNPATKEFAYSYDNLNRLINAVSTGNELDETIAYDKNGNISSLNRGGNQSVAFNYGYADANGNPSNQLFGVSNSSTNAAIRTYTYDQNGNALSDGGSQSINYNILNLPSTITTSGSTVGTYIYSADGRKLRYVNGSYSWDYVGNVVYQNGNIISIENEVGRAKPNGSTFSYQVDLKDHLGNVRLSLDKDPATFNGLPRIIQEDQYYSFGLRKNGGYNFSNGNRFLYNGKEIQTELTDQYDYGARFYDPVIARWTSLDPLAEKSRRWSPYSYGLNNPIRFIDVDGMFAAPPPDEFNVDTKTGTITKVSDCGGDVTDTYNIGTTDKKGVFTSTQTIAIDRPTDCVGENINTFRIEETANSTTSTFNIPGTKITGFILEPGGPSTSASGKDQRIPEGTYNVDDHNTKKHPDSYVLSNDQVSQDRAILIHPGNTGVDTEGCLLPGGTKAAGSVGGSKAKTKEIYDNIKAKKPENVQVNINNVIPPKPDEKK